MTKFIFCRDCESSTILKNKNNGQGTSILIVSKRNGRIRKEQKESPIPLANFFEGACLHCGKTNVELRPNHEIPEVIKGSVWKVKGGAYPIR